MFYCTVQVTYKPLFRYYFCLLFTCVAYIQVHVRLDFFVTCEALLTHMDHVGVDGVVVDVVHSVTLLHQVYSTFKEETSIVKYRSSCNLEIIDEILAELWPLIDLGFARRHTKFSEF